MGVRLQELLTHLRNGDVHRRGDDVAGRLIPQLDDVFAQIGFDRRDPVGGEVVVDPAFLRDHGLALVDRLCPRLAADVEHDGLRILSRFGPVHMPARGYDLTLIRLQIIAQIGRAHV